MMIATRTNTLLISFSLLLFSTFSKAEILFNGDWGNYIGYYYELGVGWKNLVATGQPTGNGDWNDFHAYWKKPIPHTWLFQTSSASDRISLELDTTTRQKGYVARFEVKSGDHRVVHSGERSEMYTMLDKNAKKLHVGQESGHEFYAISVKVSKDWVPPQKEAPNKGYAQWGSFMQLHSPNIYNSPPALDLSVEDSFSLRLNSGELISLMPDMKNGGTKQKKRDSQKHEFSNGSLNKGHWVQFILDINWSTGDSGFVTVYRRDEGEEGFKSVLSLKNIPTLQTSAFISNTCQACSPDNVLHYWRVGFYRSTSIDQTNTLWLGKIVRGDNINEVANAAFGSTDLIVQDIKSIFNS